MLPGVLPISIAIVFPSRVFPSCLCPVPCWLLFWSPSWVSPQIVYNCQRALSTIGCMQYEPITKKKMCPLFFFGTLHRLWDKSNKIHTCAETLAYLSSNFSSQLQLRFEFNHQSITKQVYLAWIETKKPGMSKVAAKAVEHEVDATYCKGHEHFKNHFHIMSYDKQGKN